MKRGLPAQIVGDTGKAAHDCEQLEESLIELGLEVGSRSRAEGGKQGERRRFMNRYNSYSMLNDVAAAFGVRPYDERSIVETPEGWQDLHAFGGIGPRDRILAVRAEMMRVIEKIRVSETLIMTLGLVEAWFDRETNCYINSTPRELSERFELHVLGFEENLKALEEIHKILSENLGRKLRIVVTVSPVPLTATFTGRDVVVANTYSKSVLRACAERWVRTHPQEITYFPSFEMATLSHPDAVWMGDRVHVRPDFVRHITTHFVQNCLALSESSKHEAMDELGIYVTGVDQVRQKKWQEAIATFTAFLAMANGQHRPKSLLRAKRDIVRCFVALEQNDDALAALERYPEVVTHPALYEELKHRKLSSAIQRALILAVVGAKSPQKHRLLDVESRKWGKPDGWYIAQLQPDLRDLLLAKT